MKGKKNVKISYRLLYELLTKRDILNKINISELDKNIDKILEIFASLCKEYYFNISQKLSVKNLQNLHTIKGDANFNNAKVINLHSLRTIGKNAYFKDSDVKYLANLQTIGGDAHFAETKIKYLSNLQNIGGNADFSNAQIKYLGNLENIGEDADFKNIQDFIRVSGAKVQRVHVSA